MSLIKGLCGRAGDLTSRLISRFVSLGPDTQRSDLIECKASKTIPTAGSIEPAYLVQILGLLRVLVQDHVGDCGRKCEDDVATRVVDVEKEVFCATTIEACNGLD